MTHYDNAFFQYVNAGATRSARRLLPILLQQLRVDSVLDVGCGQGAWLAVWREFGVEDVMGVDGGYVDADQLLISRRAFLAHDLAQGLDLGRRFCVVQSLEVAEHLPKECAATFVASLVKHGDIVLFSAACKGQGGDNHVNEQKYDYWRALFAHHAYVAIDFVRPRILDDRMIEPWYRYNTILYASSQRLASLPDVLRESRVPEEICIADLSPFPYRIRKFLTRMLPVSVATRIAKVKERVVVRLNGDNTDGAL